MEHAALPVTAGLPWGTENLKEYITVELEAMALVAPTSLGRTFFLLPSFFLSVWFGTKNFSSARASLEVLCSRGKVFLDLLAVPRHNFLGTSKR